MNKAIGMRQHPETISTGWNVMRAAIDADTVDTAHAATTSMLANIPTHAVLRDPRWNYVELAITGHASNDATTIKVHASRVNGDVALVWSGAITVGAQLASDAGYWVDTYTSDGDFWFHEVLVADGAGNDRMGRLLFDACGYDKIWVLYDTNSVTSDEHYTAYFSGF